MMTCERVREWLPWYVTGSIDLTTAERIASHLRVCERCRAEFVEIAQLRHRFAACITEAPTPSASVWNRLNLHLSEEETARIDLGSFLIGLRIGVAAQDRRASIRGNLRIWGRNVRIIGKKKGA